MKLLLFFLLLSNAISEPDVAVLRDAYREAATNPELARQMLDKCSSISASDTPLLVGYKAVYLALKAKEVVNKREKLALFKEARGLLDRAVSTDQQSIELRYLRLTIQANTPAVLRYKGNIPTDKRAVIEGYAAIDSADLKAAIKAFGLGNPVFTEDERKTFSE